MGTTTMFEMHSPAWARRYLKVACLRASLLTAPGLLLLGSPESARLGQLRLVLGRPFDVVTSVTFRCDDLVKGFN